MIPIAADIQQEPWAYNYNMEGDADILLLDNVQFIYELSLAELELKALGAGYQITNGSRQFNILNKSEELKKRIVKQSSYFKYIDKKFTDYFYLIQKNRTRSVNQYLTHWIYPYSVALDYIDNDSHSLIDMGCDVKKIREEFIGVRGKGKEKVDLYNEDIKTAYKEMYRILKPNKFAVIVIGNATYQGEEVQTVGLTINFMKDLGFVLYKNINKIIFRLYNVMKKENILIFRKREC